MTRIKEIQRTSITARQYIQSPDLVILAVDGAFVKATREKVCLGFFVEHIIPEVRAGKTEAKEIVREIKYEVRLSASEAYVVAAQIQGLLRGVWKETDGEGVVFNAPPLSDETAYSSHEFQDLLTDEEKAGVKAEE